MVRDDVCPDPLNTGDTWAFSIDIRADIAGAPGAVSVSRAVTADVTETLFYMEGAERVYRFDASFADAALAGSTSYFLSVINSGTADTFRWIPGSNTAYSSYVTRDGGASWHDPGLPYHGPLNFELTAAVPEPETYALMLAGLASLVFAARRRQS